MEALLFFLVLTIVLGVLAWQASGGWRNFFLLAATAAGAMLAISLVACPA